MLEHGMQVWVVTWGRLHVRRGRIRGSAWGSVVRRHRGIARGDHVWSWGNIRIAFGRGATS